MCVCEEDSKQKESRLNNHLGLFHPSVELCCKFFSSSLYLFKPSDPVCVCSREYIQSACGASPIHTDRGRSGWASERLCGKSLSWPLNPQTDRHRDRQTETWQRYQQLTAKIFWNQIKMCVFVSSSSAWLKYFGFIYKTASLSINRKSIWPDWISTIKTFAPAEVSLTVGLKWFITKTALQII